MKVRIVMLYDDSYAEAGRISESVARAYALKWGCDFVCYRHALCQDLNPSWNKLLAVTLNLPYADWVLWLDADALIIRDDISPQSVIERFSWGRSMLVSLDKWGVCCGVFAIQNCAWSLVMLNAWIELGEEESGTYGKNKWEQATFKALMDHFPAFRRKIAFLPEWLINNRDSWFWQEAWMCHFWGTAVSREMLTLAFRNIISEGWSPKWHKLPIA